MNEFDFTKHYIANASQIMWFLGAGTSRTAGMPTATDIIWDLKLKYYCLAENQDIKSHDLNNETIKRRVQSFMDSSGFPELWSAEEYSFYFKLNFGSDYAAQQRYLAEKLANNKISLNIGHRALAGLISLNKAKLVFTTNFDEVIETAYAKVAGKTIATYHLEGSYAALDALNGERFPIYAKIHGDFKYQSVKNLAEDLISNDREIQKCLLVASTRYGMIVTGYSGRDGNVMSMFDQAITQPNAFPSGLFWTVPSMKDVAPSVKDLITKAQGLKINAHIVETGTFDSMLSKIWKQLPERDGEIDKKVRSASANVVDIPFIEGKNLFPVLRTNALPVVSLPKKCAVISTVSPLGHTEISELLTKNKAHATICRAEQLLGWGDEEQMIKALGKENVASISDFQFENPFELIAKSTTHHRFFERAIVISLCDGKPLLLKSDKSFFLTVDNSKVDNPIFAPLKAALAGKNGMPGFISGAVPNAAGIRWSEAVKVKIESKNGKVWLMLKPTIWIEPRIERQNQIEFIKSRLRYRYNSKTSALLDAWISILLGTTGKAVTVETACFKSSKYPANFQINSRTAFSGK